MRSHHQNTIGIQQDTRVILKAAQQRFPSATAALYEGFDDARGNIWTITDGDGYILATGWFNDEADARFSRSRSLRSA